jgi:hypothetical protein
VPLLHPELDEEDRLERATRIGSQLAAGDVHLVDVLDAMREKTNGTDRILVIADQFEELFTRTPVADRARFAGELLDASRSRAVTVVLTLRADFYGHAVGLSRELSDGMQRGVVNVGPMRAEELRQAIVEPARLVGLELEPGLADIIVRDVVDRPGALPLMEHALTELAERSSGPVLTLQTYVEIGAVAGALAQTAERTFNALEPAEQVIARRVFVSLVQLGEGTADMRRRALIDELPLDATEVDVVETLVVRLADDNLVTTSAGAKAGERWAELTHEALIEGWKRFRDWLEADRDWLVLHRRLQQASAEWRTTHDDNLLFQDTRLIETQAAAAAHRNDVTEAERQFLQRATRRQAVRERTRYLGQTTGLATGAALGYAITFALAFWGQTPDASTAWLAFLTLFPLGALVGTSLGLSIWLTRARPRWQVPIATGVGALVSGVVYMLYALSFVPFASVLPYAGAGALLGAALGLSTNAERTWWHFSVSQARPIAAVLVGLWLTGYHGNLAFAIMASIVVGPLTLIGLRLTAVDGELLAA